ncbi:MAG TPA: HAMP domain-containing sensor histidine kinase [Myxococcota bacterium]|nr:HAMP domain-containing sensor histidine kinase [Myxococcota bacterium]
MSWIDRERDRAARREARRARHEERRDDRGPRTPEDQALREARAHAARKVGFLFHFVPYASVCFFLLITAGFRPALIVALAWGIGIAVHALSVMTPRLRSRWMEQEVGRRVHTTVTRERRVLEGAHARSLEELSASIAHEIRNPITAAKSLVQQMGEDPSSHENVEYARVALAELDRVERSISHLLRFAKEEALRLDDVRLGDVFASAVEALRERIARQGVVVRRDPGRDDALQGDVEKLRRVALNLLSNALDALELASTPKPRLEIETGANLAGSEVWARVRDNGPGMEADAIRRIFQPFYTEKPNGTGLGLAITRKLVEAHGGTIEVHSEPGVGTEFVLTFPKAAAEELAR